MATAPSACNRRQTFTRRYPGFGGIWWIRRSHDSGGTVAPACCGMITERRCEGSVEHTNQWCNGCIIARPQG